MKTKSTVLWQIEVGTLVSREGRLYEVTHLLDLNSVLGREIGGVNNKPEKLLLRELAPPTSIAAPLAENKLPDGQSLTREIELAIVPDEDWLEAKRRLGIVQYLLALPRRTRADVVEQAQLAGTSPAAVYRWVSLYLATEKLSSLLPQRRPGGKGKTRLVTDIETVVAATIEDFYLVAEEPSVARTIEEIRMRCHHAGLKSPADNTVRARIEALDRHRKTLRRGGKKAAQRFEATPGAFPEGNFPLEVVQIDHTQLDLIVVDSEHRMAFERPYITVAIDVFSRMVLGFYLTFDKPSLLSVGLCLTHAILPKDEWLRERGISFQWNAWGIMRKIHSDNAGEFRAASLQRSCEEYGIDIEWRPVAKPRYGAHIERLMGTFADEVHTLPGTTFSNTRERGEYDSEGRAILTFAEVEEWLAVFVVGKYHRRLHSGIGMSPVAKFEQGIFGKGDAPAIGLPVLVTDTRKLLLDFLPMLERAVHENGVQIDEIHYYDPVLNQFINDKDLKNKRLARKFVFKRDPRNISKIYFYHPDLRQYFEVPYRNLSNPPMSLWELKEVRRRLAEEGVEKIENETQIFDALLRMRQIVDSAKEKTRHARREYERQKRSEKSSKPEAEVSVQNVAEPIKPAGLPDQAATDMSSQGNRPVSPPTQRILEAFTFEEFD